MARDRFDFVSRLCRLAAATCALCIGLTMVLLCAVAPAGAFGIEFQGRPIKRKVLALYDSRTEGAVHQTRIHKLAEMPLNHLGYIVDYHDVNRPLPSEAALEAYRGLVTWFVEPFDNPLAYVQWLDRATANGLKLVVLGEAVPKEMDEVLTTLNRVLARIGVFSQSNFVVLTQKSRVVDVDPAMLGFEQQIDKSLPGFPMMQPASVATRAHLVIEAVLPSGKVRSTVVATSPNGGFAAQNYTVTLEPNTDRIRWILNPFRFFRLALGDERFPIPDVTTLSGRRIYFSHIDGDGWNNLTEVEGYRESQALSAEVVMREAILSYPDLPVSVGLIAADVQPLLGGNAAGIRFARQIYAQPQVEVASHTHTHPYHWNFFEQYNRDLEQRRIDAYRPPTMPLRERLTSALMRAAGKSLVNPRYDPYVAGSDDLPRTYLRQPFDLELEVGGALATSERFAPPGKRAKLYLWSGDTTPFEAAVAATRAAGVRNLNGGDSRFDREYPSVAYVPPLSRPIGAQRQIYAVNSNENTYTNDWTGPYGGQMMLVNTLDNTERPRRIKGFNLYYHMYSGEKPAALKAIRHFLAMARAGDVTPIHASHYAAMADDFFSVDLEQTDASTWVVRNAGAVGTVRFDEADHLTVDGNSSEGVIGWSRHAGSLYVAIDSAAPRAVVALHAREEVGSGSQSGRLYLEQSRWVLSAAKGQACRQEFNAQGFGAGDMVWRSKPGVTVRARALRDGIQLVEQTSQADEQGRLAFRLQVDAIQPLALQLECQQ